MNVSKTFHVSVKSFLLEDTERGSVKESPIRGRYTDSNMSLLEMGPHNHVLTSAVSFCLNLCSSGTCYRSPCTKLSQSAKEDSTLLGRIILSSKCQVILIIWAKVIGVNKVVTTVCALDGSTRCSTSRAFGQWAVHILSARIAVQICSSLKNTSEFLE